MNLTLLQEKKLAPIWEKKEPIKKQSLKLNGKTGGKRKRETTNFNLAFLFTNIIGALAKAILIVAFFYAVFLGYRFITHTPYFDINKINTTGIKYLSNEKLNTWAGPLIGKNIFQLDLGKFSKKLATHPWIHTASVRRVFPQGINIKIKERIPFARIKLDKIHIMDNYGILLGPETSNLTKLPLITGIKAKNSMPGNNVADEEIIRGLKAMHNLNLLHMFKKNPIESMHIKSKSRIIFLTKNKNIRVYMRPGMIQESLKNLILVIDTIEKNEPNLKYIDLSFKNKVVISNQKKLKKTNKT
jgi:cell division protein FtsQ